VPFHCHTDALHGYLCPFCLSRTYIVTLIPPVTHASRPMSFPRLPFFMFSGTFGLLSRFVFLFFCSLHPSETSARLFVASDAPGFFHGSGAADCTFFPIQSPPPSRRWSEALVVPFSAPFFFRRIPIPPSLFEFPPPLAPNALAKGKEGSICLSPSLYCDS